MNDYNNTLFFGGINMPAKGLEGTFALNKKEAIHRWFSYMEAYSDALVEKEFELIGYENIHTIYDPFGGSGTSLLTASKHNIVPYYSEINPVMGFVTDTKINSVKRIKESNNKLDILKEHIKSIQNVILQPEDVDNYQGFEKFYDNDRLSILLKLLSTISDLKDDDVKNVCKVSLASIAVQVSNMVRRGDLRYAKGKEKQKINQNVQEVYLEKLNQVLEDIEDEDVKLFTEVTRLADDSRNIKEKDLFDCVVTSPPYLNGTNYIRNTKLELKLLGFVNDENDLPALHSKGIIAGINNVSKRSKIETLSIVKPYLNELEPIAYDKRIPLMVAGYFYDMDKVIVKLSQSIKDGGYFIMDIGDSIFSGVHIPTHDLLEAIAVEHGFVKYDEEVLRVRHSNNGEKLSQRVLRFKNEKGKL